MKLCRLALVPSFIIIALLSTNILLLSQARAQVIAPSFIDSSTRKTLKIIEASDFKVFGVNFAKSIINYADALTCGSSLSYNDRSAVARCIFKHIPDAIIATTALRAVSCASSPVAAMACLAMYTAKEYILDDVAQRLFPSTSDSSEELKVGQWTIKRFKADYRRSYAYNKLKQNYGGTFQDIRVRCGNSSTETIVQVSGGAHPSTGNLLYQYMDGDSYASIFSTDARGYAIEGKRDSLNAALLAYDAIAKKDKNTVYINIENDSSSASFPIYGYKDAISKLQAICNGENNIINITAMASDVQYYKDAALIMNKFVRKLTNGNSGCNGPFTGGPVAAAEARFNGGSTGCSFSLYQSKKFLPLDMLLSVRPLGSDPSRTWKIAVAIPAMYIKEQKELTMRFATNFAQAAGIDKSKYNIETDVKLLLQGHYKINGTNTHIKTYIPFGGMAYTIEICPNTPCE